MQNDRITLKDLSIFSSEAGGGLFGLIDHTTTHAGRDTLRRHIMNPPDSYETLQALQDAVKFWSTHGALWPTDVSNGTMLMLEKFFESADTAAPPKGITFSIGAFLQKLLNRNEYFFTEFSLSHLSDFLRGSAKLVEIMKEQDVPTLLKTELEGIQTGLSHRLTAELIKVDKKTPYAELARLSYRARREMKNTIYGLMDHYARLDAWQAMAKATVNNKWVFPTLQASRPVMFSAMQMYHPLIQNPVPYDIDFSNKRNFLLLTGANMSGKTTFMRSLGVSALLAHIGMGVPATALSISFLQGIITNMHVEDDILKGESYFFAEVQRMKLTAQKLLQQEPHLVLMDELFKGTNVHDAYECTVAVMEGLLHRPDHLMILSTHLYEVAQQFSERKEIQFAHFITEMAGDNFRFTYHLKEGISNDRIGYRILQKEGVIELLRKAP
jgi:DNA mismatch repair protein MutS